jgi:hypothetical protein
MSNFSTRNGGDKNQAEPTKFKFFSTAREYTYDVSRIRELRASLKVKESYLEKENLT